MSQFLSLPFNSVSSLLLRSVIAAPVVEVNFGVGGVRLSLLCSQLAAGCVMIKALIIHSGPPLFSAVFVSVWRGCSSLSLSLRLPEYFPAEVAFHCWMNTSPAQRCVANTYNNLFNSLWSVLQCECRPLQTLMAWQNCSPSSASDCKSTSSLICQITFPPSLIRPAPSFFPLLLFQNLVFSFN